MIVYNKLWETMRAKKMSQYKLTAYGISRGQLDRLRRNQNISSCILDLLCRIFECKLYDISEYIASKGDGHAV